MSRALGQLGGLLATLLAASLVVFGALALAPGDPLVFLTGGRTVGPDVLAALRAEHNLDDPFLARYWHWLTGVVQGDLGRSVVFGEPVASLIGARVATTAMLVAYAGLLIVVSGIALGALAGLRPGRVDQAVVVVTSLGVAIPSFVAAAGLIAVFGVGLGWFPVIGSGDGFLDRIRHLTLPAVALALAAAAYLTRVTRSATRRETTREHVETARSRGLPPSLIVRRHVLRNALIPVTTAGGMIVAALLAGAVVVERAFSLDGLGSLLVQAVDQRDFPVVQGVVLLLVAVFVVLNSLVDACYALLDPRLRKER